MSLGLASKIWILAGAGVLGAVGFFVGMELELHALQLGAKAVPLLCLLTWVWPFHERYARLIGVGLVLSLIGDMLLGMGPDLFVAGLGAFLLAHVAYVAAYLTVTRLSSLKRGVPFALLAVAAGVFLWPRLGGLALPVTAYVVVISTMMWRSAALIGAESLGRREQWAALAGALVFAMSDGLLAFTLFVQPVPGSSYAIMLLYWAGQLGIAFSARASHVKTQQPFMVAGLL
jgi:alkenylglycerophosphocholine hydrolase